MASPPSLHPSEGTILVLLFLTCFPHKALPQNPGNLPSGPTITGCGSSLLPLAPCAPFVQGTITSPPQQCCDNLEQLNNQQPNCLCLLLNGTALRSFAIDRRLALQLPLLCTLKVDVSTCSGVILPPGSPDSQVSFGTKPNSAAAATPVVPVAPKSGIMGFGSQRSTSGKLQCEGHLMVLAAMAIVTFLSSSVLA